METKRIDYMDISKGIAMLCIVAGHMGINSITRIVFTFHVPLFFLISGYFFHDKADLIRKRSSQLLKPYFFTAVALCLCEVFKTLLKFLLGRSNTDDFLYALEKWGGQRYMVPDRGLISLIYKLNRLVQCGFCLPCFGVSYSW